MSDVIERLYQGLHDGDGEAMAACYTPDAKFQDPVFGILEGGKVGDMWRMLTEASSGTEVDLSDVEYEGPLGSANWLARYTFDPTGRRVVNHVQAAFLFRNGLIAEHADAFSFYSWSRQALGPTGLFFGWTPMARRSVQTRALKGLERYVASRK
ncbi:nuclear transport factor 2 family protein [bacterium]|nr:nuclear transport factor 2 family protein [bacterium]